MDRFQETLVRDVRTDTQTDTRTSMASPSRRPKSSNKTQSINKDLMSYDFNFNVLMLSNVLVSKTLSTFEILQVVEKNCFMVSLDIKDAFN